MYISILFDHYFYEIAISFLLCDKQTPLNVCFVIMSNNYNREPKRQTHSDAEVRRKNSLDPTNVKHTSGSNSREEEIFLLVRMRATEVLTEAKRTFEDTSPTNFTDISQTENK